MKKIKFSHNYHKLHMVGNPFEATLIAVFKTTKANMCDAFIEYDTVFDGGHYPLPSGELLVLLFMTAGRGLFTTIRSNRKYPYDKEEYYRNAIGEKFEVALGGAE